MDKNMTVKDLVAYLQTMPQEAELFVYAPGTDGFYSLDDQEQLAMFCKASPDDKYLYLYHAEYIARKVDQG
ncbi:hypothetical protein [Paenibacillus sp. P46E]|uniref:hypothetical protein n=1 Tax=Paenibacillus sp. P46E TaxID=1349436 RepID=UPI00094019B0|nr:hypothetical protein [Paenibacillus sp. P46E]OKP97799.1 hypothetical protein A3849_13945 [Paenibacillus sp. P46E]